MNHTELSPTETADRLALRASAEVASFVRAAKKIAGAEAEVVGQPT
jgi:hypothetical protein